jgi:hypothetical protein
MSIAPKPPLRIAALMPARERQKIGVAPAKVTEEITWSHST